jgi:alkylation response protein AidB-like acyl-CoA dehydrogenase
VGCRRVPKALVAAAASTKVGQHAQDTAELFFDGARVPVANLLGEEGTGFAQLVERLPQERLSIAVHAIASSAAAFDLTRAYCMQREAFGQPIGTFQHNRFTLAEMSTEIDIGQSYVDQQVLALNDGALTAEDAVREVVVYGNVLARARSLPTAPRRIRLRRGVAYCACLA